jgi:hypothetical protein
MHQVYAIGKVLQIREAKVRLAMRVPAANRVKVTAGQKWMLMGCWAALETRLSILKKSFGRLGSLRFVQNTQNRASFKSPDGG